MRNDHPISWPSLFASSAEFVGEFWLKKLAECMKQGEFYAFRGAEAIRSSDRQFGLVVEALDSSR